MATGDIVVFNAAKVALGNKLIDFDSDTFKFALVTSVVTPAADDAAPHFGGTGTTNYATNQVTPGGNYTSGGPTLASLAYTDISGVIHWQAAKVTIAQHASNPTNARWAIIFNDTDANKRAVAYVDLGSARDLSAGPFEFRFNGVDGVGTIVTVS